VALAQAPPVTQQNLEEFALPAVIERIFYNRPHGTGKRHTEETKP